MPKRLGVPELTELRRHAGTFRLDRFGARSDLGRQQVLAYLRHGWGITNRNLKDIVDAHIESGDITASRTGHFRVPYQMARGASASGFDVGSRPVSFQLYKVDSVDRWVAAMLSSGGLTSRLSGQTLKPRR